MLVRHLYIVCLAAAVGCTSATSADGVTIRIDAENATARPMKVVPFTLVISNGSAKAVSILAQSCPGFEVLDGRGVVVGPITTMVCNAVGMSPLIVESGASITLARWWSSSARTQSVEPQALPPGRYFLRTRVAVNSKLRWSPLTPVDIVP